MARKKSEAAVKPALPEPGPDELDQIKKGRRAHDGRTKPPRIDFRPNGQIASPHSDVPGFVTALAGTFGTKSLAFTFASVDDLVAVTRRSDGERSPRTANAALALVAAIEPRNELEAALAVQMAGTHAAATKMLDRLNTAAFTDSVTVYGNMAVKLQRTFAAQVEALAKLRTAGKQIVEVNHVHTYVGAGGQAIIGDVTQVRGGEIENQTQPHAIEHMPTALAPEMRSQDAVGLALSGMAGSSEEAMPDARRPLPGGA